MNIKYLIIHFTVMSHFFLDIHWHGAGCFDRQLQNTSIQKRLWQTGMLADGR
jgi:hypothetical protein